MKAKLLTLGIGATAILLFIALLAQAPHAAEVFLRIAPPAIGWEFYLAFAGAWLYAIALESATAYFVWQEETRLAWIFAFVSVVHNLCYYMPATAISSWLDELTFRYVVSALLVSFSLPVAIAAFSHVQAAAKRTTATTEETATQPQSTTTAVTTTGVTAVVEPQPQTAIAQEEEVELDVTTFADTQPQLRKTKVRKPTTTADGKMTKEQRRMHIAESGNFDVDAVMAQYSVGRRTAEGDIAEARKLHRNEEVAVAEIAVQLPQLAIATTNGFGAH